MSGCRWNKWPPPKRSACRCSPQRPRVGCNRSCCWPPRPPSSCRRSSSRGKISGSNRPRSFSPPMRWRRRRPFGVCFPANSLRETNFATRQPFPIDRRLREEGTLLMPLSYVSAGVKIGTCHRSSPCAKNTHWSYSICWNKMLNHMISVNSSPLKKCGIMWSRATHLFLIMDHVLLHVSTNVQQPNLWENSQIRDACRRAKQHTHRA